MSATQEVPPEQPSIETGEGCFELHYDYSNANHFSVPLLINALFRIHAVPHHEIIPVITDVKQLTEDRVEVRRHILYKNFYNTISAPEEVFIIDRSKMR